MIMIWILLTAHVPLNANWLDINQFHVAICYKTDVQPLMFTLNIFFYSIAVVSLPRPTIFQVGENYLHLHNFNQNVFYCPNNGKNRLKTATDMFSSFMVNPLSATLTNLIFHPRLQLCDCLTTATHNFKSMKIFV